MAVDNIVDNLSRLKSCHLCNEMSSVGYWYAAKPTRVARPPAVSKRMPVLRDNQGGWLYDKRNQTTSRKVAPNREMRANKEKWRKK